MAASKDIVKKATSAFLAILMVSGGFSAIILTPIIAGGSTPECAITSPSDGATVSGTVTISGTTADGTVQPPTGLAGKSHVVIAVIDSGTNPYHTEFRAPMYTEHPSEYITGYPENAEPVNLTFTGNYNTAVNITDKTEWKKIQQTGMDETDAGEGKLYYFPGTKVIGAISFSHSGDQGYRTLDGEKGATTDPTTGAVTEDEHGTATTSCVAGNTIGAFPEALIVIVETDETVDYVTAGYMWAANQPWIDIITSSVSSAFPNIHPYGFALSYPEFDAGADRAMENGKLFFEAAGNGVANFGLIPTTTYNTGSSTPSVIAVGSNEDHTGMDVLYHDFPVQITGIGTSRSVAGTNGYNVLSSMGGTSFAAPAAAGIAGRALYFLRQQYGDMAEGVSGTYNTMLRNTNENSLPSQGPFENGILTCQELREAVLKTAREPQIGIPWYVFPATIPDSPLSFVKEGYGDVNWGWETSGPNSFANATTCQNIVRVIDGTDSMPKRPLEEFYLEQVVGSIAAAQWGEMPAEIDDGDLYPEDAALTDYSPTSSSEKTSLQFLNDAGGAATLESLLGVIKNYESQGGEIAAAGVEGSGHFIEDPSGDTISGTVSDTDITYVDVMIDSTNMIFTIGIAGFTIPFAAPYAPLQDNVLQYEIHIDSSNFEAGIYMGVLPVVWDNSDYTNTGGTIAYDTDNNIVTVSIPLSEISEMNDGSAEIYVETNFGDSNLGTYGAMPMVDDRAPDTGVATYSVGGGNIPPTCTISANMASGEAPLDVLFPIGAADSDGSIASWALDTNNDGMPEYQSAGNPPVTQTHTYTADGTYTAKLTVTDDKGATATDTSTIVVGAVSGKRVEVSTDGGVTWQQAEKDGTADWSRWKLDWDTAQVGDDQYTIAAKYLDGSTLLAEDSIAVNVQNGGQTNQPPIATISADKTSGYAPLAVTFTMDGSDTDGSIASWALDVTNDGTNEYAGTTLPAIQTYEYALAGTYTAKLAVTDDKGATGTDLETIVVNMAPAANCRITDPIEGQKIYGSDYVVKGTHTLTNAFTGFDDSAGDAAAVTGGSDNMLDILKTELARTGGASFNVEMTIADLTSIQPPITTQLGTEAIWRTEWQCDGNTYFVSMQIDMENTVSYSYGYKSGNLYQSAGTAEGSYTNTAPGTITIGVENYGSWGSSPLIPNFIPAAGVQIANIASNTLVLRGVLGTGSTPTIDSAGGSASYIIGDPTGYSGIVEISLDDPDFASPDAALLSGGSWQYDWDTAALAEGSHAIYARQVVGGTPESADSVNVIVSKSMPPTASFNYTTYANNNTVAVDASDSTAGSGTIVNYEWSFGDGAAAAGETATHTYAAAGTYQITLTVTNSNGDMDAEMEEVAVPKDTSADKWAVFVAISDYPGTDNDLPDCHMDAETVRQFALQCGFSESRIKVILNSSATVGAVTDALEWLAENADEASTAFFYYSGHGGSIPGSFTDSYINLYDGELYGETIKNTIGGMKSKKVLFGFDACQNGFMDGVGTGSFHITDGLAAPGRIIVSASCEATLSWSTGSGGAFTTAFVKEGLVEEQADGCSETDPTGITGEKDGKVSIEEAFWYAFYRCETAGTAPQGPEQLPQMNDKYDGEMFFEKALPNPEQKSILYFHSPPPAEGIPAGSSDVGSQLPADPWMDFEKPTNAAPATFTGSLDMTPFEVSTGTLASAVKMGEVGEEANVTIHFLQEANAYFVRAMFIEIYDGDVLIGSFADEDGQNGGLSPLDEATYRVRLGYSATTARDPVRTDYIKIDGFGGDGEEVVIYDDLNVKICSKYINVGPVWTIFYDAIGYESRIELPMWEAQGQEPPADESEMTYPEIQSRKNYTTMQFPYVQFDAGTADWEWTGHDPYLKMVCNDPGAGSESLGGLMVLQMINYCGGSSLDFDVFEKNGIVGVDIYVEWISPSGSIVHEMKSYGAGDLVIGTNSFSWDGSLHKTDQIVDIVVLFKGGAGSVLGIDDFRVNGAKLGIGFLM